MQWQGIKSNGPEGDKFLSGIINTSERWKSASKLFTDFALANGYEAWHKHTGWVMNGHEGGNVLGFPELRIIWFRDAIDNYENGTPCPSVGQKIILIKDSPIGEEYKPVTIYCYEVIERIVGRSTHEIKIKRIDEKKIFFDQSENCYKFYSEKSVNFLSRLFG